MQNSIRRRTTIIGKDEEYSKEIVDDFARAAKFEQKPSKSIEEPSAPELPGKEELKPPVQQAKEVKGSNDILYVRPAVWMLPRHQAELSGLEEEGYKSEIVLRLARQQTQKRFRLEPRYIPATTPSPDAGQAERIFVRVAKKDLDALSKQAGDLGTIPPASLIRAQVQEQWIKELDAVIEKLKGRTL